MKLIQELHYTPKWRRHYFFKCHALISYIKNCQPYFPQEFPPCPSPCSITFLNDILSPYLISNKILHINFNIYVIISKLHRTWHSTECHLLRVNWSISFAFEKRKLRMYPVIFHSLCLTGVLFKPLLVKRFRTNFYLEWACLIAQIAFSQSGHNFGERHSENKNTRWWTQRFLNVSFV